MAVRKRNHWVKKRSVRVDGQRTSVSIEDEFWDSLKEIAAERRVSTSELIGTINSDRQQANLSSAIRLFVLSHYRGAKGSNGS